MTLCMAAFPSEGSLAPQGTLGYLQIFLAVTTGGRTPGMLINISQCTEQPQPQRVIQAQNVSKVHLKNLDVGQGL